jgi:iron complex transport system substrate-binding protein
MFEFKIIIDQLETSHAFDNSPKRIVSLVPSQTDLLFDLGLEQSIIGITKFCVHPNHFLKFKAIIGGTKNPNFDKIKALNPDIIICNKDENSKEIVEECSKICNVWVTDIVTIDDNYQMISDFGAIFEIKEKAALLNQKIEISFADFENFMKSKSIKKVAYFIWKNPYMVAGKNTFINALLQLNKFDNVYKNQSRYPEIDIEKLKNQNLDLILLSSEPYPFAEKDILDFQKISPKSKVIIVDGEMFSWHGSRLIKAFEYFKTLHHN